MTELSKALLAEIDTVTRDMAHHVGDQIHDVLQRNGMAMKSSVGVIGMMVLAAAQTLAQAVDFASRTAGTDVHQDVADLFLNVLNTADMAAIACSILDGKRTEIERATPYIDGVMGRLAYSANNAANPDDLREWAQSLHDDLAKARAELTGTTTPDHISDTRNMVPPAIDTTD